MIKGFINKFILVVLLILSLLILTLYYKNISLSEKLSISKSNEKAFIVENSGLKNQNREFQFTVEQLNYFNDSLIVKMNEVRKELKVKDKDLKQMQYLLSEAQRVDTIVFRDTIFYNPSIKIDTLIGDEWYKLKLGLRYPNTIITEPSFISEKYIITNYKKETIEPPKKFFLLRWFQKKHKIVEVNVVEKNPYIKNKNNRFIEVIE